jgi:pimeloyl-ACP methyl ester carboxylesterase
VKKTIPPLCLVSIGLFLVSPQRGDAVHKIAHCTPPLATAAFAPDFPILKDREWGYRLGGWGGVVKGLPLQHPPVIFVHGNTRDAGDWDEAGRSVKQRFLQAGYSLQELWALSYNGRPTKAALSAFQCATDNTRNVPDLTAFIEAVLAYTGARQIDVVAHSMGVTLVRSTLKAAPALSRTVRKVVAIAGPNHGTTVCRRLWLIWLIGWSEFMGCDEIVPGSTWLRNLNHADDDRETGAIGYLTLHDGTGADVLYQRWLFGWPVWDQHSPTINGATNIAIPGLTHDELRIHPDAVAVYLRYLGP